jgi:membrane peptidoglycan carboxypeptidase
MLFGGPMTIRQALSQSRNIPAVKALYLTGINDSIATAEAMGITSLKDPARYGLTLVLGGGEVSLLELTSAYGVFANDGIRNPYRSVLKVEDSEGNILEESHIDPTQAIPSEPTRQISDILSDPSVMPSYLSAYVNPLDRSIAVKTGTTNDSRDVWIEGYTPNLVVGAWAGKNDNTPMDKKIAGVIITPVWGAFMSEINNSYPKEFFKKPEPTPKDLKPVLRGVWKGGISYNIDSISGKLATDLTPDELKKEIVFNNVHTILNWVDKDDPRGEIPKDPKKDSQYENWEYGVRKWFEKYQTENPSFKETDTIVIPTEKDDIHTPENVPQINIISPKPDSEVNAASRVVITLSSSGKYPLKKSELYINDRYITVSEKDPRTISFIPADITGIQEKNIIKIISYDTALNHTEATFDIIVNK